LEKDAYEISQINSEIQMQMISNNDYDETNQTMNINISTSRLSSIIEITNPSYQIDFTVDNSIGSLLGFNKEIIKHGYNKSTNIVDIMNINSILVNTDFISSSVVNGTMAPAIHSFYPRVGPGYKIIEIPRHLIYYPINSHQINSIRIWLTDQDKKIVDIQGERVTVRIAIREIKN
jgi:hypothetical protein